MKKTLILVAIVAIMACAFGMSRVYKVEQNYNAKLEVLESAYQDLSDQVYNYMTEQPYEIRVQHDGKTHYWAGTAQTVNQYYDGSKLISY